MKKSRLFFGNSNYSSKFAHVFHSIRFKKRGMQRHPIFRLYEESVFTLRSL